MAYLILSHFQPYMNAIKLNRIYPAAFLAAIFTLTGTVFAQCTNTAIPGKFYEYYIIAQTGSCNGNTFTSLGGNPSINDIGQVGFMGQSSALSCLLYTSPSPRD